MKTMVGINNFGIISQIGTKDEIWNRILNNLSSDELVRQENKMRKCTPIINIEDNNIDPRFSRRMDKQVIYQLIAGNRTVENIDISKIDKNRIGIFTGSLFAQLEFGMEQIRSLINSGDKNDISMYTGVSFYYGAASGEMSILLKTKGENASICDGACSGIDCVISAFENINRNINDIILAIGGENLNEPVIAEMIPKPDNEKSLMNPEKYFYTSGAVSVLLSNSNVLNSEIEIISTLNINDYDSLFNCGKDFSNNLNDAIKKCLSDANVSIEDVDMVVPGFNNTGLYDIAELETLNNIFSNKGNIIFTPIPFTGDMLSASGNIKIYVACMCINQNVMPANDITFFDEALYRKYQHLFVNERTSKKINTVLIIQRDIVGGRMSFLLIRKKKFNANI